MNRIIATDLYCLHGSALAWKQQVICREVIEAMSELNTRTRAQSPVCPPNFLISEHLLERSVQHGARHYRELRAKIKTVTGGDASEVGVRPLASGRHDILGEFLEPNGYLVKGAGK